jgi:hypothetical protein
MEYLLEVVTGEDWADFEGSLKDVCLRAGERKPSSENPSEGWRE